MRAFLFCLRCNFDSNLSKEEAVWLFAAAVLIWLLRKKLPALPVAYSVFFIVYITLLRRVPGGEEILLLRPRPWTNASELASGVMNLLLYFPFGWTGLWWCVRGRPRDAAGNVKRRVLIIFSGAALSAACEMIQYLTGRGWADCNDLLANVLGTICGVIIGGIGIV